MNPDNPSAHAGDFAGKVAVVTGGSGALSGPMALALGQRGAAVVVVAHSRMTRAQAVARQIFSNGGRAIAVQADVLDRASLEALAQRTIETFGRVDMLINGAGGGKKEATTGETLSFFDLSEDAVRWVFDLNFMGTFLPCQVFGRLMVEQDSGCILNIASMSSQRPLTRVAAYSAAKAAVVNFTQWLAVHFSQEYSTNIRVNALAPGFFLTEQNRFLLTDERTGGMTQRGQTITDHTPMGRLGDPEDLISTVLWLLSDEARFVHGAVIAVDGGFSAFSGV